MSRASRYDASQMYVNHYRSGDGDLDECPILDAIDKRCESVDLLGGGGGRHVYEHDSLLPACTMHQFCYLCVSRIVFIKHKHTSHKLMLLFLCHRTGYFAKLLRLPVFVRHRGRVRPEQRLPVDRSFGVDDFAWLHHRSASGGPQGVRQKSLLAAGHEEHCRRLLNDARASDKRNLAKHSNKGRMLKTLAGGTVHIFDVT